MADVVANQFSSHRAKGLLDGGELPQYVGAIGVKFNHLMDAANLTLNAPLPGKIRGLNSGSTATALRSRSSLRASATLFPLFFAISFSAMIDKRAGA